MAATTSSPPRARLRFHRLTVTAIAPASADSSAVAVSCHVPDELRSVFTFVPGQHITVRATIDGEEIRRSYSLCSTPSDLLRDGTITVGIRAVSGGLFSAYAAKILAVGDTLELLPPVGNFGTTLDPLRRKHYGAIVAGSGITPVLSLISAALATEPLSKFTVLYGNRLMDSLMFPEELADLKNRYLQRLHLIHIFSAEDPQLGLPAGRLDHDTLNGILTNVVGATRIDEWFLCGPEGLTDTARKSLVANGYEPGTLHTELFHTGDQPTPRKAAALDDTFDGPACEVTIRADGRTSTVRSPMENRVLDAALAVRPDLPYSCTTGVCATCRAKVVSGTVTMDRTHALTSEEQAAGYVLTCQSTPLTGQLTVDFDAA